MPVNVGELVRDIDGAARIVKVLREVLPAGDAPPVRWSLIQEDVTAHIGRGHNVRALLVLRRLAEAGLVEIVLEYPHAIPHYRRKESAP